MRKFIVICIFFVSSLVNAQDIQLKNNQGGLLSLGVRSTISAFNDSETNNFGKGIGGQFRMQLSERVNTDWFFDYLTSDIGSVANRTDYHIGWSVLFYPYLKEKQLFKPYIVAGHCFDYSYMAENSDKNNSAKRWSSAVQAGIGTHINITKRMDLSITSQYMMHLGGHIHPVITSGSVSFENEGGFSLEGHLLLTVGLNYKLIDLW
jgi:opacity protein-like surface antigen